MQLFFQEDMQKIRIEYKITQIEQKLQNALEDNDKTKFAKMRANHEITNRNHESGGDPSTHHDTELTTLLDGCYHVYLDVGSNVGVQVRKLYEQDEYPDALAIPVFNEFFGGWVLQGH